MACRSTLSETALFRRSPKRLLHRRGIAAALASCAFGISSLWAQSPCSIVTLGATPTGADVTAAINMALGTVTCTSTLEHNPPVCTVITVQRVTNAFLGVTPAGYATSCIVFNAHAAILNWTASTTPGTVTYNVYRATASTGPFTRIASSISGTTFTDNAATNPASPVQAGQTYYYEVTAVASGVESTPTSPVPATIPSP
jgi:hypothetical protein